MNSTITLPTKKVSLRLEGLDGNVYSLMGAFSNRARREGWTPDEIDLVITECKSSDYDHALATLVRVCRDPEDPVEDTPPNLPETLESSDEDNPPRPVEFSQVCIWEGTTLGKHTPQEMLEYISQNCGGARLHYLEQVTTNPDPGDTDLKAGGRVDQVFAVHRDDTAKFAVPRLSLGIRWIEDIFGNGHGHRYPNRFSKYRTW